MKKFFALALAVVLCMSLSLSVFASDYVVGEDGNAAMDDAYGYVFSIDDINGTIGGEDATIITDGSLIGNIGLWSRYFIASKVADNEYVVATAVTCPAGTAPAAPALTDGQVIVAIHSASSNPSDEAAYPNWHDYVAAAALKVGDKLTFAGIDLAAGTVNNGTITVSAPDGEGEGEGEGDGSDTVIVSKNVAAGKSYTTSGIHTDDSGAASYPDEDGKTLTDGINAPADAAYNNIEFVGFNKGTEAYTADGYAAITVDLADKYDLNKFVLKAGSKMLSSGITAPATVSVYVSDDNQTWTAAGEVAIEDIDTVATVDAVIALDEAVNAQYVQFRFTANTNWMFVAEVEAYADVEEIVDGGNTGDNGSSSTPSTPVKPGDASNTVVFAIIALVAIAGSAVVIKTRK